MKTLYLVRHARAIPNDVGVEDFKRPLSKRGKDDAQTMSKGLKQKAIRPDLFMSSPADRALETAHIFAKKLNYPIQKILLKEGIYDEEEESLRDIVRGIDDAYNTVMIFGHEPAIPQFAGFLMQDSKIELRTAGIIGISLDISYWRNIEKGSGTLMLFDFPVHATSQVYQKARKAIAKDITSALEDILENIAGEASVHLQKIIRKTSKKLAKEMTNVLHASKVEEIAGGNTQKRLDMLKEHRSHDMKLPEESPPQKAEDDNPSEPKAPEE